MTLPASGVFDAWRQAARVAISHRIAPQDLDWTPSEGLFAATPLPDQVGAHQARVSPFFLKLAQSVIWHSAPERFGLLYQALWHLDAGEGDVLDQAHPLGRRLGLMSKSVGRDIHKMHAFVRFRELPSQGRRRFGAWFEPEHYTLEPGSTFFARRFADMDWTIATPYLSAQFQDGQLRFHAGGARPELPQDASEQLWATYFANIFNPARVKMTAMRSEMPKKYWKNLPETQLIPDMLRDAEARVSRMQAAAATRPSPQAQAISTRYRATMPMVHDCPASLDEAAQSAAQCRRCSLCEAATQTVWGEGAADAALMIVGEQPGDQEDLHGRPFVGPAGQLLRDLLEQADLGADQLWLTNAVKHFRFAPRGAVRVHQTPQPEHVAQCRWWLDLELAFVRPRVVVALGATATLALTGQGGALAHMRGRAQVGVHGGLVLPTWHPSYVLRLGEEPLRQAARAELLADLRAARQLTLSFRPV